MIVNVEQAFFYDRTDAGKRLALKLNDYRGKDTVVFAIPRGGIPVALEVATELEAALDIVIVRKIPIPYQTEAGFGAIAEDGTLVLNDLLIKNLNLDKLETERLAGLVRGEIMRRSMLYRRKIAPSPIKGKTVIIIDDGLASGYTMLAAIRSLRQRKPAKVVVAIPVSSESAFELVLSEVDYLVSLIIAQTRLFAVAGYYQNWHDLNDDEVFQYLEAWRSHSRV